MRDFPKDRAHADGLGAGVIGGHGGIFQNEAPGLLDLGIAFLEPAAVGGGGRERQTVGDTSPEIALVRVQGGSGEGVTAFVDGQARRNPLCQSPGYTAHVSPAILPTHRREC